MSSLRAAPLSAPPAADAHPDVASSPLLARDRNANNGGWWSNPIKRAFAIAGGVTVAATAGIGLAVYLPRSGSSDPSPTPSPTPSAPSLKFCATLPYPLVQCLAIQNDGDKTVSVASYSFDTNQPTLSASGSAVPPGANFISHGSASNYHDTVTPAQASPLNIPARNWVYFYGRQDLRNRPNFVVSRATVTIGNNTQEMLAASEPCSCPHGTHPHGPDRAATNTAHTAIVKQRMKQLQTQSSSSFWSNPAKWLASTVLGDAVDVALAAAGPKKRNK